MKRIFPRALSLLLALSLLAALTVSPALASEAMGDDLTATDTLLNRETQLSTNVFWSTISSDYRTENLITYTPNASVTPIVTYGGALTDRSSVSNTAKALEEQGYRVVAGINGDFYNVNNGLPIGVVVTQGRLRSSDGGYHAIGFRSDGTAILGKPAITMSVRYTTQDGAGEPLYNEAGEPLYDELGNPLTSGTGQAAEKTLWPAALNKARTESGVYLYTYDFNASHTTGATQPGVDVVCTIQEGNLALGGTTFLKVERIAETEKEPTPLGPTHVVLSANAKAGEETLNALRSIPVGTVLTLALTPADPGWNDVQYAAGALYSLVENGAAASGLPTGAAPRTAVGQRYDGSLVFYTIDGRKSGHSIGATMDQVARRLIELGCVTALGLDGGGSTTLAVTKPTDTAAERINQPSDRVERSVSNQIFLVASNQPTGQLSHFYVSADNAYVLAGSSAEISAAAVDTNFIPMNERYDLTASAGTLSGNILTTPLEGGDITVTAQGGGGQGSTVVHAVTAPDGLAVRNADNAIITELSASPGTAVQLHGSAYKHLPLKADPAAFTWALEGDIGTIDETGLFTATALGTGKITVSAGTQSASIDVTVSTQHLETLEDFEGETTIFRGSGEGASFSLNRDGNYVRFGKASGKLDYDLTANAAGGTARWNATAQPAVLNAPYTGLNLWVDSNGSGNTLSLLYGTGEEETQVLPLTTLDVSGWKQVSVNDLPAGITIRGLEISGTGAGTIYLDQVVATFDGTVDSAAPVITAELDPESRIITGSITDGVDGILPAERISISSGGEYEPATGRFTVTLPAAGAGQGISRVTIRAKDYSGNIGRASVDLPASGGERRFTDTAEYWGADYCDFLYNQGISGGYDDGTFRPDDLLTRLDFSVMLYNALRLDPAKYAEVALPFADLEKLPEGALPAVRALYAEGVVTGTQGKDGKLYFNPAGNLTRAQASAMIGRSQEKGYALAELTFTDAAQIPGYASFYIRTMVSQGILSGYDDGTFRPQANITRGQMAKILYTML